MSSEPPASSAHSWLESAAEDLNVARDLVRLGHAGAAAFHAQQAAEKALKGAVVSRMRKLERTHDLVRLARILDADQPILERAAALPPYYTAARYPDAPGAVTADEAAQATGRAEEVVEWARARIS